MTELRAWSPISHREEIATLWPEIVKAVAHLHAGTLDRALDDRIDGLTIASILDEVAGLAASSRALFDACSALVREGDDS